MHIPRTPDQIAADRARYEAHQQRGLNFAPAAMPAPSPRPAPPPDPGRVIWRDEIAGGWYRTVPLAMGEVLRIEAALGTSVSLAVWAAGDASERMNLPDTVKVQWTTELRKGRVILSDMGRVLLSVTEDSSGAHDALTGGSTAADVAPGARNCRDNMVLAAGKLGLDRRDLPALWTLFAPVRVDAAGRFGWRGALLSGEDWVELRAERDLRVALSNTRHPLDPATGPEPAVRVTRLAAVPVAANDPCRTASAEAMRGFENNARA
jgi:urea carboxylase-associated protein 2